MDRLQEIAHTAWLNIRLFDDEITNDEHLPSAEHRATQLRLFADGYGLSDQDRRGIVGTILDVAVLERLAMRLFLWHTRAMPRSYSRDLRERLVQARASGLSATEIARVTGVSARSVHRWTRIDAAGHALAPGRAPGRARRIVAAQDDQLRAQVAATPDATRAEHGARWAETTTVVVSPATMCRALRRLDLSLNKRR